jgi:DNA-binding transcriptional LysR family regulator
MPVTFRLCSAGMDVELRHLRAFLAVARSGSFTRAAEELLITQPALTRTIQQLESALSVRLLERTSRHVELTPAGREFRGHAERVLADLDIALASVAGQVTVRLGFSWLLPDPWAQDAVAAFERASGNSVALVRSDDPLAALRQAAIDVALIRGAIPDGAPVRRVHLFDEVRVAVCSSHSELAGHSELDWDEVPRWPLVVNTVSGTTGPWSWPPGQGPARVVETANFDEWLESVAAGRGIGVVPDVAMRRNIHSAVRFIPLRNAPPSPVWLAFLPHIREPLMRQFVAAAVAAAGLDAREPRSGADRGSPANGAQQPS